MSRCVGDCHAGTGTPPRGQPRNRLLKEGSWNSRRRCQRDRGFTIALHCIQARDSTKARLFVPGHPRKGLPAKQGARVNFKKAGNLKLPLVHCKRIKNAVPQTPHGILVAGSGRRRRRITSWIRSPIKGRSEEQGRRRWRKVRSQGASRRKPSPKEARCLPRVGSSERIRCHLTCRAFFLALHSFARSVEGVGSRAAPLEIYCLEFRTCQ